MEVIGMSFYYYRPDSNNFNGIGLQSDDAEIIQIRHIDNPISEKWKPIVVFEFDDNPVQEGDFPSLSNYNELPVMSKRAWDYLQPLIGYCCEALPIRHPTNKPYFIIHVMQTIDCLNVDKSEVTRYSDGRIMEIDRYSLKLDM